MIQRKSARLGRITTRHFANVLEPARLQMRDMYSLFCSRPEPLVSRDRIFGVAERVMADGSVRTPLEEESPSHRDRARERERLRRARGRLPQ
jgi:N-methylhydantoinase A